MGYREKVSERFEATTDLSPGDALARARRVIEDLGSVRTWRLGIESEDSQGFSVVIKPTILGALNERTTFTVTTRAAPDGRSIVNAEIGRFAVYQEKFLWFIPAGPKSVPGIAAYLRSLDELRAAFRM